MNIFVEMVHSVYDIRSYEGFLNNGRLKTFFYGVLLSVIYAFLAVVLPIEVMLMSFGGIESIIRDSTPNFTLENDRFWVEEPVEYKQYVEFQGGIYVKADSDHLVTQEITDVDLLAFDYVIVMDAENAIIKTNGEILRFSYAELGLGSWDKERVVEELIPYLQGGLSLLLIFAVCFSPISFFAGAFVVAVMGIAISSILNFRMKLGELFKLSVHARTTALLIKAIHTWLPVSIPYFSVLNFGISVFYMWKAIKYIKQSWQQERMSSSWTGKI